VGREKERVKAERERERLAGRVTCTVTSPHALSDLPGRWGKVTLKSQIDIGGVVSVIEPPQEVGLVGAESLKYSVSKVRVISNQQIYNAAPPGYEGWALSLYLNCE
jgi:hypothetical protein